jgi:large subunit ribosomal protein L32e
MIMNERKKPKFMRQGARNIKRVGKTWRKPMGSQSKMRKHKNSRGSMPNAGYGSTKSIRGLHPSGFEDVLIFNTKELEKIDTKKQACRIASTVGKRKRLEIIKKASELKIKILNPVKAEKKKEKTEKKEEKKKSDKKV